MGSGISKNAVKPSKTENEGNDLQNINHYDEDVVNAVDLAIAIQKEDYKTNIELSVSCENLPKLDIFSLTDPMVVAYMEKDGKYIEIGKTEIIADNSNPKFAKTFLVKYSFEAHQRLRFVVYDIDSFKEKDSLDKHDLIGVVDVTLHEIICSPAQCITRPILNEKQKKRKNGTLTIRSSEYDIDTSRISFQLGAKSFLTKSDLYVEISAIGNNRQYVPIYISELKTNIKKGFEWKPFFIASNKIFDEKANIKFDVFESTKSKYQVFVGSAEMSLYNLMLPSPSGKYLRVTKNGLIVGELKVIEVKKVVKNTFLNYVYAGCEISLIIALDFTNSNKDPKDPKSLHCQERENEYIQALNIVGGILQYYDGDNRYPVYGFGAKLPPYHNVVSHCFALNGNFFDPEVTGLDEVLNVYREAVKQLKFHGPTVFSEIVKMASEYAASEAVDCNNQKYFILLVITDGVINDLKSTIDEIVKASDLPLSIIIIGVGDQDFSEMKLLDGDEQELFSETLNRAWSRDIVQFIPFSSHKNDYVAIARETLAEVPKQFLEYMTSHGIEPIQNPKTKASNNQEFVTEKLKEKTIGRNAEKKIPSILKAKQEAFYNKLIELDFDPEMVKRILDEGIQCPDINLIIELMSQKESRNISTPTENNKKIGFESTKKSKRKVRIIPIDNGKPNTPQQKNENLMFKSIREHEINISSLRAKNMTSQKLAEKKERENKLNKTRILARKEFENFHHEDYLNILTKEKTPGSSDDNVCLVCRINIINTVFMPCGHAALCFNCSKSFFKVCTICNKLVKSCFKTSGIKQISSPEKDEEGLTSRT